MRKIGEITPKASKDIKKSRLGIGLEKLDRDLYDPTPCYDDLALIGVKWVRIQSGWCRTEREKGKYDFSWLDAIVDNLIKRDMVPWICLCYGNGLYTKDADNKYGAVGRPPIFTDKEKSAWSAYVSACVKHFGERVSYYEVWNEPDGPHCWRHGVNPAEYAEFTKTTSVVIRKENKNAKIIAGSFCAELSYLYDIMKAGIADYIDYISYHRYKFIPDKDVESFVPAAKAIIELFSDKIELIQGETGTQSENSPNGALCRANWSERKQAKFLLRKMTIDLATDVYFTSYFTAVDIFENILSDSGEKSKAFYGFFGVLGERFDEMGTPLGTYYKKESFYAFRTLCSIMAENVTSTKLPLYFYSTYSNDIGCNEENPSEKKSDIFSFGFKRDNGAYAMAYWKCTDLMTTEYESTVSFKAFGMPEKIRLIDTYTGDVYELDEKYLTVSDGSFTFKNVPVKDYPLFITFGDFAEVQDVK